jgi:hypothetical protein
VFAQGLSLPTCEEAKALAAADGNDQCAFIERTIEKAISMSPTGPQGEVAKVMLQGLSAIYAMVKQRTYGTQTKEQRVSPTDFTADELGAVKVQQTFTSRLKNESDFRNRVFSYCYRLLLEQGEPAKAREILADVEAEVARRAEVERMIEG